MEFNSLEELYKRVLPALKIKVKESLNFVDEKDIWEFLSKTKWSVSSNLTLGEMVNDILKCDISLIDKCRNGENL